MKSRILMTVVLIGLECFVSLANSQTTNPDSPGTAQTKNDATPLQYNLLAYGAVGAAMHLLTDLENSPRKPGFIDTWDASFKITPTPTEQAP